jgi:hypothetical protein
MFSAEVHCDAEVAKLGLSAFVFDFMHIGVGPRCEADLNAGAAVDDYAARLIG